MPVNSGTGREKVLFQILAVSVGLRIDLVVVTLHLKPEVTAILAVVQDTNKATTRSEILTIGIEKDLLRQSYPMDQPLKTWIDLLVTMGQEIDETLQHGVRADLKMDPALHGVNSLISPCLKECPLLRNWITNGEQR